MESFFIVKDHSYGWGAFFLIIGVINSYAVYKVWIGEHPLLALLDQNNNGRIYQAIGRSIGSPVSCLLLAAAAFSGLGIFALLAFTVMFFVLVIGVFSWPRFLMVPQARTHPGELAMWRAKRKGHPTNWKPDYDIEKVKKWQQRKLDSGQDMLGSMLFNHPKLSWNDPQLDRTKFNQKKEKKNNKKIL